MNNPIFVKDTLLNVEKELMSIKDYRTCKDWVDFHRSALETVMRLQWETIVDQWIDHVRGNNVAKSPESEEVEIQ